jgi:hypothetical protein
VRRQRTEDRLHELDRREAVHPPGTRSQLAGRLGPAQEQQREGGLLGRVEVQLLGDPVRGLGDPGVARVLGPHQLVGLEIVDAGPDVLVGELDDRVTTRGLVAGAAQRVDGQRVVVGGRERLLHQTSEHPLTLR